MSNRIPIIRHAANPIELAMRHRRTAIVVVAAWIQLAAYPTPLFGQDDDEFGSIIANSRVYDVAGAQGGQMGRNHGGKVIPPEIERLHVV